MDEKLLDTIVGSLVSELIKESKSIFDRLSEEGKSFLKIGIKNYLNKQKEKYSFLKTLLRGNTPVYIYEIYYPLKLIYEDDIIISTNTISDIFKQSNYLTIIGDAGSGKSTLVKHLFLNSIYTKYAIPILIELRYLNEYNSSIETYIIETISENKITGSSSILERLLKSGKFVFFLDGYDELTSDIKQKVIRSINVFITKYNKNKYVITSRPYSDIEHHSQFHNYYVKSLSMEEGEIEGFIFKQLQNEIEFAKKIILSIKTNESIYIHSFLKNPLLLSLYILTFQSNSTIPNKKYIFYRRVINALFSEHDSKTKLGFVREKISGLEQEEFETLLKVYCFLSYFENSFNWDSDYINKKFNQIKRKYKLKFSNNDVIKDLKSAIALWLEDNGIYSFAHRSLQEYYAAYFIKNLNSEDNKRIYQKIIDRLSKFRSLNEIENFLSLLEEMDTLNFKRYYLLPSLNTIRKQIKNENNNRLVTTFIQFLSTGINIPRGKVFKYFYRLIVINEKKVYKTLYINISFTRKLHNILTKCIEENNISEICSSVIEERNILDGPEDKSKLIKHISFKKEIPECFLSLCYKDVLKLVQEFDKYLTNKIKETKKFIKTSIDTDRDIVDLI